MVLLPWILGCGLAAGVAVAAWTWRRYPSRLLCPECAEPTAPVVLTGSARALARWVHARWCPACAWQGLGRRGPAFDPVKGPAAHDSGFRWSRDSVETGVPGFRWGDRETPSPPAPPAHASGFRWADTQPAPDPESEAPSAHPSGFRWASRPAPVNPLEAFEWKSDRTRSREPAGFRWKDADS